jgi:DNA helicase IV
MDDSTGDAARPDETVDLDIERAHLARAQRATTETIERLKRIPLAQAGHEAVTNEWIEAVVTGDLERLQQQLVVFGRVDDERPWRVGLYGVDDAGDQIVVDWRAPFASCFYQASFDDPMALRRRVTYVGSIDDLFVEDFATGEVQGTSPLLTELSRSRGEQMRAAVATLQSEQDRLVRLPPRARVVVRGGPGTGKTVVGLHRAAWLVYNDQRVTAERILVLGPSDRYLRFIATVLPTLGEVRVVQTTFDRLLGPSNAAGSDPEWIGILDRLEASLLRPQPIAVGRLVIPEQVVAEAIERIAGRTLPWRDRRQAFVTSLANRFELRYGDVSAATKPAWPQVTTRQAWAKVRSRRALDQLGVDRDFVDRWLDTDGDGVLHDEVRARFEGVPARYSHVMVDEAQDLSLLQLRAVLRRGEGLTLVGDDAQRSNPLGIGLMAAAVAVDAEVNELDTAYRMSAEIADWLNQHAVRHHIPAVTLVGIRPTGVPVTTADDLDDARAALAARWSTIAVIEAGEVWEHKGVEYDAVVVDGTRMTPEEIYLAASRAAHQLVVIGTT